MAKYFKQFLDAILSGKGQVLLLILILAAGVLVRFGVHSSQGLELAQLTFATSSAPFQGKVVYSDVSQDLYLVLVEDKLFWRRGEANNLLAEAVVNLLLQDNRLWLKTETQVAELIVSGGFLVPNLVTASPENQGVPFAQARLVGKGEEYYYLRSGSQVLGLGPQGLRAGSYELLGRRNAALVEGDWRRGVVFIQDDSWKVYTNYEDVQEVPSPRGKLREVVLSPNSSHIVYAIQVDKRTEIWHAQACGAGAELVYEWEMEFSDIEAMWTPDQNILAISVLGFQGEASFQDTFHSATFLYHPGQEIMVLSESHGPEIKALVPTAWDTQESVLWSYWLHEEVPTPVSYHLFP